jgi:prevent-host-death family protein
MPLGLALVLCTSRRYTVYMKKRVSVRELREKLASVLDEVAKGHHVIITRHEKAVARIIPERWSEEQAADPHPLRGSVKAMSADFDEPLEELWEALES